MISVHDTDISITEAVEADLPQCYLCAKKHLQRAKKNFEEYHTGYPDHVKNLIFSTRVAEDNIKEAFIKWMDIQGDLDMAACELLGHELNPEHVAESHINIANAIRDVRLAIQDDPLYCPDFDKLLIDIHILQYTLLDNYIG